MRACGFKPIKACAHESVFCAAFAVECRATTHHGSAPGDGRVVKQLPVLPDRGVARVQPKLPRRIRHAAQRGRLGTSVTLRVYEYSRELRIRIGAAADY